MKQIFWGTGRRRNYLQEYDKAWIESSTTMDEAKSGPRRNNSSAIIGLTRAHVFAASPKTGPGGEDGFESFISATSAANVLTGVLPSAFCEVQIMDRFCRFLFAALALASLSNDAWGGLASAGGDPSTQAFEGVDGYVAAGFEQLSTFKITPPPFDPQAKPGSAGPSLGSQIPDAIRRLDGRKAVVTGFMLPIKMEGGLVTEFLLMRSQMMCCYGVMPQVNEWVLVHMPQGVHQLMDVPVSFGGQLHVKELYENGFLTAIYQLDSDKILPTKG